MPFYKRGTGNEWDVVEVDDFQMEVKLGSASFGYKGLHDDNGKTPSVYISSLGLEIALDSPS